LKKISFFTFFTGFLIAIILSFLFFFLMKRLSLSSFQLFISSILFSIAIAAILSGKIFSHINRRFEKIESFTEALGRGFFEHPLKTESNDRLGKLESALADSASSLGGILENLKDAGDRQSSVLACMGDAVIVLDRAGKITLANRRSSELFETTIKGKNVSEISRDPKLLSLIEICTKKRSSVSDEVKVSEPHDMTLEVTVSPLLRNMNLLGSVLVLHDITILKKLETMRKDFVVNVSHELKTPLTSIGGFSETLLAGGIKDSENALRFVQIIKNNTDRLCRLVDDLLTLSNIEFGKIKLKIEPVPLLDSVRALESLLGPKAKEKGLEFSIDISPEINIEADRDRLMQVLMNLVDNAIKFSEKGTVSVSAKVRENDVVVSVSDSGMGIPKKDIHRLGERFYRVDAARSRDLGGTGLGLAIVKHLIASMGGALEFDSVQGHGTTVRFTLLSA